MKSNLTFDKAFSELTKLVDQIEDEKIQVDTLTEKVKAANDLIMYCETKLRAIDTELKTDSNGRTPAAQKKNRN